MRNICIITTCTKKKIATPYAYLSSSNKFENLSDLATYWKNLIFNCPLHKKIPASELYRGRGFKRALRIVDEDASRVEIISAGLGFVKATDRLPPYNLTTSVGASSHVKNHITLGRFDPVEWWSKISNRRISETIESRPDDLFIIACSRAYLEMIMDDLLSLTEEARSRIRIVGNDLEQISDYELFDYIMPYDLRLNSIDSPYAGSKIDFAQRAAHHLVKEVIIKNPDGTPKEHQQAVFASMESFGSLEDAVRNHSIPNEDLRILLLKEWNNAFGRLTRLLGLVRQKYGFSCSENRLKLVMDEIKADMARGIPVFDEIEEDEEEAA